MKYRIKALIAGITLVAGLALAGGLNVYDGVTYQSLHDPDSISAASTGTVFDVGPYKGIATIILSVADLTPTNGSMNIKIQHATASAGTYTTLTNEAGTAVSKTVATNASGGTTTYKLDTAVAHRYLRALATPTTATGAVSAIIVLPPK